MFRSYTVSFIRQKTLRALALCCALALPLHGAALAEPISDVEENPTADIVLDDERESVRTAQRRLIALGLLSGSAGALRHYVKQLSIRLAQQFVEDASVDVVSVFRGDLGGKRLVDGSGGKIDDALLAFHDLHALQ